MQLLMQRRQIILKRQDPGRKRPMMSSYAPMNSMTTFRI
ncbi:MAG: hypothetical protein BWY89_01746 [Bacteroidetes bacterium ADurb.BinA012]|nr:MAG: hypothetical protein BWY89_01746 [Bacteroidetes bacterium ADurb.BinA012]